MVLAFRLKLLLGDIGDIMSYHRSITSEIMICRNDFGKNLRITSPCGGGVMIKRLRLNIDIVGLEGGAEDEISIC